MHRVTLVYGVYDKTFVTNSQVYFNSPKQTPIMAADNRTATKVMMTTHSQRFLLLLGSTFVLLRSFVVRGGRPGLDGNFLIYCEEEVMNIGDIPL